MPVIPSTARALPPSPSRLRPARSAGGFALPDDGPPQAHAAIAIAEVSLATLLALQGDNEPVEDRDARRHGQDLLAELTVLHRILLGNIHNPNSLERLAAMTAQPRTAALDPRLEDAVAAIRLRARVELARYAADP